jgi:flavodoxin
VAFFSFGGSTARLARLLAEKFPADLGEIVPAVPYPEEEGRLSELARDEGREGKLPELAEPSPDPSGYGAVLVGSPVWWFGLAGPVRTWLSKHDFTGKAVRLFVTHGGGGPAGCQADLVRLARRAEVARDVLAVRGDGSGGLDGLDLARALGWLRDVRYPGMGDVG